MSRNGSDSAKAPATSHAWHALSADAVLHAVESGPDGLTEEVATARLAATGPNELAAVAAEPVWRRMLRQFNDPLILFLLAAALMSLLLEHFIDAGVIAAVVLVNATVGFVQEGRAEQAMAALRGMLSSRALVRRDGVRRAVPVAELVPGDVILLEAGDRVPADARLLRERGLRVDESVLTGESVAAEKSVDAVAAATELAGRAPMLHSGTLVTSGQATAVVVATGARSEVGRIGTLLGDVHGRATPLLEQMARFSRRFAVIAIAISALLFLVAVAWRDYAWLEALILVVALTVSLVPESMPAVITITLATGVRRMAARQAIIRRLPAVETLGATNVICTDKTGTLTRNEMTVRMVAGAGGRVAVDGAGYAPHGAIRIDAGGTTATAAAAEVARIGLLCNDARLLEEQGQWRVEGDPMEGALLAFARKMGLDEAGLRATWPRVDEVPFDAAYRFMATLHRNAQGGALLCVKGAPEQVLALSTAQLAPDGSRSPLQPDLWRREVDAAGLQGQRVLGFALAHLPAVPDTISVAQVADLTFAGVAGFIDPPREEAIEAVAACRGAGIAVKMITGDHAATATAIAGQLVLADSPAVLTGQQLEQISDEELAQAVEHTDVFARSSPEHKLRIVRALQSHGHTVAMTGDGVNDAPALKQADIGVAMGIKGTEAAKEASGMVLADDNFASIAAAVHEGRAVYDNIRKVVAWTLPTNGGEMLAVALALVFGAMLPMTAPQILWVNLVLTVSLGLSLAFELPEPGVMRRLPRRRSAPLISPFMLWRIVLVSLLFSAIAFSVFSWAMSRGLGIEVARTMVVNAFCVMEIFYLFSVRYLHASSFSLRGVRGTVAVRWAILVVVLAQLAFTYLPVMNLLFGSRPVPLLEGSVIVLAGVGLLVLLEGEKWLLRRLGLFDELRPEGR